MLLLIVFLSFVKIDVSSCIFDNRDAEEFVNDINVDRYRLGLGKVELRLQLQVAAEKRCSNTEQLWLSYQRMLANTYDNEDWPRQEHLNQIFVHGSRRIERASVSMLLFSCWNNLFARTWYLHYSSHAECLPSRTRFGWSGVVSSCEFLCQMYSLWIIEQSDF